jgi:hypothetical protein
VNNSDVASEPDDISSWKDGLKTQLLMTFRAHVLFIILVLAYAGATYITAAVYGVAEKVRLSLYSETHCMMTTLFLVVYFIGYAVYVILLVRPDHPIGYILNDLKTNRLTIERLLNALPIFLFMPIFFSAFTSFKSMIPIINPFCWDSAFARWDLVIHGGHQPWQLLHPVFGYPLLTSMINFFYNLWFFVMFGILFWQTFSLRNARLRMQFLLTYMLSWILLGTFAAIILSSAGPCYYSRLVEGQDIYRPLMEYLSSAKESFPVWALGAQEMLWQAYKNGGVGQVTGISAMPSMHVSVVFLFALVGWRTHRIVGIGFSFFAILIMIGCVHLGWHYAIDGYVAIVCTWLIWWFVGKLLGWIGVFINV